MRNPKNHLTADQAREAVSLFLLGVEEYTKISAYLKVNYQAVNTYMTKWKKENGLLKTRKTRSDKKVKSILPTAYKTALSQGERYELEFLRRFYFTHVDGHLDKAA